MLFKICQVERVKWNGMNKIKYIKNGNKCKCTGSGNKQKYYQTKHTLKDY